MAFLVFKRIAKGGSPVLCNSGERFQLGGYHLLFRAWDRRGRPTNEGWHVSADDLIQLHTNGTESYDSRRLIIDWAPGAPRGIGLIELLDVYAYTYQAEKAGQASWTPLMLHMRDVLYEVKDTTPQEKERLFARGIPEGPVQNDFVEFLYLQGDAGRWNFGRNGSTNAAFIQSGAREYFRQYF